MKKTIVLLLVAIVYLSCQKLEVVAVPNGTIEGTFTLSPLCGVEPATATPANPCGFSDARLDEIYGQYKIVVTDAKSYNVTEKKFDRTGIFSFDLPVGSYNIDLQPKPQFSVSVNRATQSFPASYAVKSGQKTTLTINVDTGLR